ncbi:MAG: hypothetical protein Q9193_006380 [Seirophora villosa]
MVEPSAVRQISFSCRGASITDDQLFEYTNGHFLADEEQQRRKRYVKFDVQELCNVVSSVTKDGAAVSSIDKMEGGFSKALLMTTETRHEVIAKLPNPTAGRARYLTASEAAVLQYVSDHTTVPVPKVLDWNDDPSNAVGAEYIIMEKAPGIQLHTVYGDLQGHQRLQLVESLTKFERELASIRFPAYGSLYLRHSINDASKGVALDPAADPTASYCIGPQCGPSWTDGSSHDDLQADLDAGPWFDLSQFGLALARRSLARTRLPVAGNVIPSIHGTKQDHEAVLNSAARVLPLVATHPLLQQRCKASLWHHDLHLGNIFVSEDNHAQITCIIDWQGVSISPLFCQERWPIFLRPPEGYREGLSEIPKLPENYGDLDKDDQLLARLEHGEAIAAKAYEATTHMYNHEAYNARFCLDETLRELFAKIGDTWDDGIPPLQARLVKIFNSWEKMGFTQSCPVQFASADIESISRQNHQNTIFQEVQALARKCLNTDTDGWLRTSQEFAEKQKRNPLLLELAIGYFGNIMSADEVKAMWPFPPLSSSLRHRHSARYLLSANLPFLLSLIP